MAKARNVVIVESPAKAKTIGKYLGSGYKVTSSMGHVRDLPPKRFGIDVKSKFRPTYEIIRSRHDTVEELKKATAGADAVYLATDLDREGEAIAWHLVEALSIPPEKARRVTFNEITQKAIQDAFAHPRQIDLNKVNAQQARRILDRIVGYELSPLLWKKVARGLSAGRVQSVAVRLICEREKEIQAFRPEEYWRVIAKLVPAGSADRERDTFEAELKKLGGQDVDLKNEPQAAEAVERVRSQPFVVGDVSTKILSPTPPPPFVTSTLQQAAANQLGFSTRKTMAIAQRLYEGVEMGTEGPVGLITYMRTDSVNVSEDAIGECRGFVPQRFGKEYLADEPRRFRSSKRAQQAHEAIRPTSVIRAPGQVQGFFAPVQAGRMRISAEDQYRLYELIWNRFVATQMAAARIELTDVSVNAGDAAFQAKGRRMLFDGYQKLTPTENGDQHLPPLQVGQPLELMELTPSQHFTKPPARYTEASLVRTLEKEGIGRPSTYATIISTIQDRGYVKQVERKFHATELGMLVTDKLVGHFPSVMDTKFTSNMEDELDKIEEEHLDWIQVLNEFYGVFSENLERAKVEMEKYSELSDEVCEKCGKPMAVKFTAKGKFLACSGFPKCKTTKPLDGSAPRQQPQPTEYTCDKCGSPMVLRDGSRGKFLACGAYPKCRNAMSVDAEGKPVKPEQTDQKCEKCGSPMIIRDGRRGKFLACSAYPKCRNAKSLDGEGGPAATEQTDQKCEKCGSPMLLRDGRRGKFLACSAYPKCRNAMSVDAEGKPVKPEQTDQKCEKCGKPMVIRDGRRGKFLACSGYPKCRKTAALPEDLVPQAASSAADVDKP